MTDDIQAPSRDLVARLGRGEVGRREFIRRAAALGLSASAIAGFLAACGGSSPAATSPAPSVAPSTAASAAPSAAPSAAASVAPTAAATRAATASGTAGSAATATRAGAPGTPGTATTGAVGTPNVPAAGGLLGAPSRATPGAGGGIGPGPTKRGGGGTLKILYWQAATSLNPHLATGPKDKDAARLAIEALAEFAPDDTLVPWLAAEIPTIANGGLAADYTSVTWKLKPGVKWSDGQPFTAKDCVFTWQYVSDKTTGAGTISNYAAVAKMEAVDDLTVKVTFTGPTPAWYLPLTDAILPEHIFKDGIGANAKNFAGNLKPIGTGPYKIDDFKPGDSVSYSINPNWRDANGPFFDKVEWKGGGDAASAARAVFQTGDYQLGWNLLVEPAILNQIIGQNNQRAKLDAQPGQGVEQILFNFADPLKEVDGEKSSPKAPHPFLADKRVRQALTLTADRKQIADVLYGAAAEPWPLLQSVPASAMPQGAVFEFNLDKAAAALDAAGWRVTNGTRAKDGVQMKMLFQTTVNSVRQKEQQILKDALGKIGIPVELKSVESSVYFSSDPGNNDTFQKFQADLEMTSYPVGAPDPQRFLAFLTTAEIAQKSNNWALGNAWRYSNADFDKLNAQSRTETDPAKRAQLFQQQYKLLYDDAVGITLVARKNQFGYATGLEGIYGQPWSPLTWNIANWVKK